MSEPWVDWIPGVLANHQIRELEKQGFLVELQDPDQAIDASAVDLHIGSQAYETVEGSIKPFGDQYLHQIQQQKLVKQIDPDESGAFKLKRGKTYLFEIIERLEKRTELAKARIFGQATPKSSVGRMDVLVRLVLDHMDSYDGFIPGDSLVKSSGHLFLEVTPITFSVKVKPGVALSQLRFIYGSPENCEFTGEQVARTALGGGNVNSSLTVDLEPVRLGKDETPAVAFRALQEKQDGESFFELWEKKGLVADKPDPKEYWQIVPPQNNGRLTIKKDAFYILRSKEKIRLPKGLAVYCRAVDETIGEMRIHYAGFVHPGFGRFRKDGKDGTPLIFEVRGHDLDVSLKDGQTMAHIQFYRMSEDPHLNSDNMSYETQTLQLSKYFQQWT